MLNQYFITYQLGHGWYVTSSPIITADWRASSGDIWTVPFGGGVGRHEAGISAGEPHGAVLWKRSLSVGVLLLEHADANFIPVPQAHTRREKDIDGRATEEA